MACRKTYYAKAAPSLDTFARIAHADNFFAILGATIRHGGNRAFTASLLMRSRCRRSRASRTPIATTQLWPTNLLTGRAARSG